MSRRRQADEEQERSAEDGRASAIGAASQEINPSGRAVGGTDAASGLALRPEREAGREEGVFFFFLTTGGGGLDSG